ncbi:MAG: DNA translocase FtsK [Candidatus Brennerbacteria bacterium]
MAKRKKKHAKREMERGDDDGGMEFLGTLHPDVKRYILSVLFFGITVLFLLAAFGQAGPWGSGGYKFFSTLFGIGYYLLPLTTAILGLTFATPSRRRFVWLTLGGAFLFVLSGLGFIDIISEGSGGLVGEIWGALEGPFGTPASLVMTGVVTLASLLVILNRPLHLHLFSHRVEGEVEEEEIEITMPEELEKKGVGAASQSEASLATSGREPEVRHGPPTIKGKTVFPKIKNYVPPPLSLLVSSVEKPTIGDLRANANIIKRTLESFGVSVEMGEIHVGPTVTRYTLKPAEGMKLSRIVALHSDLALALAAHPIRIEAPIPGKSLVGIEVPNKAAALVRLGSLIQYPDFQKAEPLTFALGRNVSGEPIFPDIGRMPHLLVAGATGSGKSIAIHSLLVSLLYKNSPDMLRMILIDPKRVELSIYDGIPHLIAPVVTENKKALGALRWLIGEMDRRYELLLAAEARDIKGYNNGDPNPLPYVVMVIDEMADLMTTYGREVEGYIIRLAQMARATGIHLVVSTQRPSVEVITGLIKANITSRVALQVASQVDSRTIIDTAGAEKLLGNGDLLFMSAEKSKPVRIQGSFLTEEELKKVIGFIKEHNETPTEEVELIEENGVSGIPTEHPFESLGGVDGDDDELLEEAVMLVKSAKKASASLLQRRLKVGYARAARLLDIMEEKGIIGPGDGAKPREVYDEGEV